MKGCYVPHHSAHYAALMCPTVIWIDRTGSITPYQNRLAHVSSVRLIFLDDSSAMNWLTFALPIASYLLGSIATAVVVSRLLGLPDPRTIGSGNPGATNVLRTGNKLAALATLIGDLLKGLIPVVIARADQWGQTHCCPR